MRLVKRDEMLKLPPGTVYQMFDPNILGELMVKGENSGDTDWYEQPVGAYPDLNQMQFEMESTECREARFDDTLFYLVYEDTDIEIMVARLKGNLNLAGPVLPIPE